MTFSISGKTEDGFLVLTGAYEYTGTHGVPLEVVLEFFKTQKAKIDWVDWMRSALKEGMSLKTAMAKISSAVGDVYGKNHKQQVVARLKIIFRED